MKVKFKHVHKYTDRHGALRVYYKPPEGGKSVPLPTNIETEEFNRAYWDARNKSQEDRAEVSPRRFVSMRDLVDRYYLSFEFRRCAPGTQTQRTSVLEQFCQTHGDKPFRKLERTTLKRILEGMSDRPGRAINVQETLRGLFYWAMDCSYVKENPAARIRLPKTGGGGFHSWTDAEIDIYRRHWSLGTSQRTAFELLLGTAQRGGDVFNMNRDQIVGDCIKLVQEKTGERMEIPLFPDVKEAIAHVPAQQRVFVLSKFGRPMTKASFQHWFVAAAKEAGLPAGRSAHGLRKAAARRMAEAGATAHEIRAMTGHKTLKEVELYTKAAAQTTMAREAMGKVAAKMARPKSEGDENSC